MNNNRLSTNIVVGESIDRVQLYKSIRSILAEGDTYSYVKNKSLDPPPPFRGGVDPPLRPDLLNEKEVLLKSFPSVYSCAKFLGVNKYRVNQSLKLNKMLIIEDRVYYVRER